MDKVKIKNWNENNLPTYQNNNKEIELRQTGVTVTRQP